MPLDPATEYAGEDADIALRLWLRLKPRLAQENVTRVYERVDKPLVPVLARMERRGIKVDREYLARLSAEFARDIQALEEKIYEAACGPFTIGIAAAARPGAVRAARPEGRAQGQERAIFDRRQRARAARGARACDCARLVLDWRQLTKLKITYTDALQAADQPARPGASTPASR